MDPLIHLFRIVEMGEDNLLTDPVVRKDVGDLLGLQLSKDLDKAVRQVLEKWSVLKRYYTRRCVDTGDGSVYTDELCIYIYKEVYPSIYYRNPVLATMRGLVVLFRNDGVVEIVSRPFDKFFNTGEVPDTEELPTNDNRLITKKYDGSLIHCFRDPYTNSVRCATRGLLDVHGVRPGKVKMYIDSPRIDDRLVRNPYVKKFWEYINGNDLRKDLEELVDEDHTVMFELVCEKPASVQPGLPSATEKCTPILLARRNKKTLGIEYVTGEHVFPTPETYNDIPPLNSGEYEGVVVYYPNRVYKGIWWWKYLVKVKDPMYLLGAEIHPHGELHWGKVMRQIVLGKGDDLLSILPSERETIRQLWRKWEELRQRVCESIEKDTVPEWFRKRYGKEIGRRGCESVARKLVIEATSTKKRKEQVQGVIDRLIKQFGHLTHPVP